MVKWLKSDVWNDSVNSKESVTLIATPAGRSQKILRNILLSLCACEACLLLIRPLPDLCDQPTHLFFIWDIS